MVKEHVCKRRDALGAEVARVEGVDQLVERVDDLARHILLEIEIDVKPYFIDESLFDYDDEKYLNCWRIFGVEYDGEAVRIADLYKAEYFDSIFDDVRDAKSNRKLLNAICCSPRYRDIKVNYYIDNVDAELEKQFSATTFILPDGTAYIAFRGTDSTIVGWKEDFNMSFQDSVPAQRGADRPAEGCFCLGEAPL